MNKDKQHIDEFFRKGLKDLKVNPPSHVLDKIRDKLEDQKKKRRLFILRTITAAAVIIIAFGTGYFLNQKPDTGQISSEQTETSKTGTKAEILDKFDEKQVPEEIKETLKPSANKVVKIVPDHLPVIVSLKAKEINTGVKDQEVLFSEKIFLKKHQGIIAQSITHDYVVVSKEAKPDFSSARLKIASLLPALETDTKHTNKSKKNKWSITGQISPTYSYRNSQNGPLRSASMESFDSQGSGKPQENALLSVSGGMQMSYNIGNKWELASGLYYSVSGIVTKDFLTNMKGVYAINSSSFNNSIGAIKFKQSPIDYIESGASNQTFDKKPNTEESTDLVQHFEYLEVPLLIKHKFFDEKIGVHILGGINTGFLVGNNAFFSTGEKTENIGSTFGIRKMSYNSILGFGVNFAILKKLSLNFEPSFKYSLRPINSGPENYYPWSIDIFTGVVYHF